LSDLSSLSLLQSPQAPSMLGGANPVLGPRNLSDQDQKPAFLDVLAEAESKFSLEQYLQAAYVGKTVNFRHGRYKVSGMVTKVHRRDQDHFFTVWNKRAGMVKEFKLELSTKDELPIVV